MATGSQLGTLSIVQLPNRLVTPVNKHEKQALSSVSYWYILQNEIILINIWKYDFILLWYIIVLIIEQIVINFKGEVLGTYGIDIIIFAFFLIIV